MSKSKCIILRTTGSIIQKYIDSSININNLELDNIKSLFKKTGTKNFERHCDYDMGNYVISIFGWKSGKSGTENKTELPPPEDIDLYFGDILVIKTSNLNNKYDNRKIEPLSIDEYKEFINKAFGGFESLGDSDTESDTIDDKYDSDDSFIVNSDEVDDTDNYSDEEEEFKSEDETSEDDDNISLHSDSDKSSELNSSKNSSKNNEESSDSTSDDSELSKSDS